MPLFKRCDGDLITREHGERKMMPFLMRGRNEAFVLFEQVIDVTNALAYLEKANAGLPEKRVSFFHLCLLGIARAAALRPQMNRFISGGRIYQRKKLELSFAVKKKWKDDAAITAVKREFHLQDTLDDVVERVDKVINVGRGEKPTSSERDMDRLTRLPALVLRFVTWLYRALDAVNLLPRGLIESDELYASIWLANLGSVGLPAPYHHLYEWGTCPLFGVIGRIEKAPAVNEKGELFVRQQVVIKWTFDERITDGFYCAKSLDIFDDLMQNPALLEKPPEARA